MRPVWLGPGAAPVEPDRPAIDRADPEMRLAPWVAREHGTDGLVRLGLHDVRHAVLVSQRPTKDEEPASTSPSMKAACAGQSDCSSSGRDRSHSGPERRSTTRNIATLAFLPHGSSRSAPR